MQPFLTIPLPGAKSIHGRHCAQYGDRYPRKRKVNIGPYRNASASGGQTKSRRLTIPNPFEFCFPRFHAHHPPHRGIPCVHIIACRLWQHHSRNTLFKIPFASATLSATTGNTRGGSAVMRSSRASLTAAMIDAQIASVALKRSLVRSSSSLAFACLISPILATPVSS